MDRRPILIVPYMWIGDFVRCHSVVKLLNARFPDRPVDILSTTLCAPLTDYMPGLRRSIVFDLPRSRLALTNQLALARRLRRENYGTALIMPRTWKSVLAPFLAGIPERTGFVGEARARLKDARPDAELGVYVVPDVDGLTEPLTGQRTQACESCHGRLLLADALGLVDRRDPLHFDRRLKGEQHNGRAEVLEPVADVRSEPDESSQKRFPLRNGGTTRYRRRSALDLDRDFLDR